MHLAGRDYLFNVGSVEGSSNDLSRMRIESVERKELPAA
jgi:hypothetical protein